MSLIDIVLSSHWSMEPDAFRQLLNVVDKNFDPESVAKTMHGDWKQFIDADGNFDYSAVAAFDDPDLPNTRRVTYRGSVALIPVTGPIFPRANLLSMSGGNSISAMAKDFQVAIDNDDIKTIIMTYDSPGGNVVSVNEFAERIYSARKKKNIVSYVYGIGASAAYWLASSASKMYLDPTSQVGSIGVVSGYVDRSKAEEKSGSKTIEIVSSQSPKKRMAPTDDSGKAYMQEIVDQLADVFVSTVARNRSVSIDTVLDKFGQGGLLVAKKAIESGMADGMSSLETLIEENQSKTLFSGGNFMSISVEELKAKHAETYQAVLEEGKQLAISDVESMSAKFRSEGATNERNRIASIEALNIAGAEEIIATAKLDEKMTAEKVGLQIIKSQQEFLSKNKDVRDNARGNLLHTVKGVGDENIDIDKVSEEAINKAMVDGAGTHAE